MDALSWLLEPDAWVALVTLTALEVVLGIDNVIFISILAGKLPGAAGAGASWGWGWPWSPASCSCSPWPGWRA